MSNRRGSIFQFAGLGEISARLIRNRHDVELSLAAGMICDPCRAVPIVLATGITADSFDAHDLRVIAAVAIAAAQHPQKLEPEELFELLVKTLKERRCWNDAAPVAPPFIGAWNGPNLRKFVGLEYFCRASLQKNARRLLELAEIQRKVAGHLFKASDLAMEGACR